MQRAMRTVLEWPQSHATSKNYKYEPQQKHRLGTVSKNYRFYGIQTSPSASIIAQNIQLFGPREGFLTHQWIITGNKYITDKYYDKAKTRTRQESVATDTRRASGCRTTPREHWSKRKPTVEPRWAKQQYIIVLKFVKHHPMRVSI